MSPTGLASNKSILTLTADCISTGHPVFSEKLDES